MSLLQTEVGLVPPKATGRQAPMMWGVTALSVGLCGPRFDIAHRRARACDEGGLADRHDALDAPLRVADVGEAEIPAERLVLRSRLELLVLGADMGWEACQLSTGDCSSGGQIRMHSQIRMHIVARGEGGLCTGRGAWGSAS